MKKSLILFSLCLILSNSIISQTNSIDSIQTTKIVRLINDFRACKEYSSELESRLKTARKLLSRASEERDEYARLYDEVDSALKEMTARNENLKGKLTRTRKIGIIGTIGGIVVGFLVVLII